MKIERVQYDGEGQWLDVLFDDGKQWRVSALFLREKIDMHVRFYERHRDDVTEVKPI